MDKKTFLNSSEVSRYFKIPLRTIQNLAKEGKINAVKIGKQWRYSKDDIEQFFDNAGTCKNPHFQVFRSKTERRAYSRLNCNLSSQYLISIPSLKTIKSKGSIRSISAGGVFLHTGPDEVRSAVIDDPINISFELSINQKNLNIIADGRIVRKTENGIGIKFRSMPNSLKNRIIEYVG